MNARPSFAYVDSITNPEKCKLFIALISNSHDNKIYVARDRGGQLTVVDCSADRIIRAIHLGEGQPCLFYNPTGNRVFCTVNDTLLVIDAASDSVVAVHAGAWTGPFVVNAVANKVYLYSWGSGVLVLDGTTGVVLDSLNACAEVMCLDSRTQKLYTGGKSPCEVMIFDCTVDTLVDWFYLRGQSYIYAIDCDTATNKVYAACDWNDSDVLVVMDGVADTVAAKIPGPHEGKLLAGSKRGCVYTTDSYGPELAVYDTGTDSLLRTIFIGGSSGVACCYDSIDDKVCYLNYSVLPSEAGTIDAATNQMVGQIRVGPHPQDIIWHAPTNRVYCSGGSLTVIDPKADTMTKVLPLNSGLMCSAPEQGLRRDPFQHKRHRLPERFGHKDNSSAD
jgi:DNA-binding beta-propeller fold protein YncE